MPLIDRNANIVIVECKQGAPNVQHVAQLRGYMRNVEKLRTGLKVGENIRGILVHGRARKLSPEVREDSRRNPQIELVQFSVAVGFTLRNSEPEASCATATGPRAGRLSAIWKMYWPPCRRV